MTEDLKTKVRVALAKKNKNQEWLANELKMNPGQLSRLINGRDETAKHIERIKGFLGI
ncbi:MAG: XRE family transcriptional regulator [Carnobacterium sp.]|uniref:XRE family transcriptional regulator n=1 Tax=Carnobacterium sp. TaxID=48221 RepID=UPI002FCB8F54